MNQRRKWATCNYNGYHRPQKISKLLLISSPVWHLSSLNRHRLILLLGAQRRPTTMASSSHRNTFASARRHHGCTYLHMHEIHKKHHLHHSIGYPVLLMLWLMFLLCGRVCLLHAGMMMMPAQADDKSCYFLRRTFKGWCSHSSGCENVCLNEAPCNNTGGKCGGWFPARCCSAQACMFELRNQCLDGIHMSNSSRQYKYTMHQN